MPTNTSTPTESDSLLNWKGAAAYLEVKPSTVRRWTFERKLPCVRISRRCVRYRKSDLEKLVKAGYRPALRQPEVR